VKKTEFQSSGDPPANLPAASLRGRLLATRRSFCLSLGWLLLGAGTTFGQEAGTILWSVQISTSFDGSAAIGTDGTIYVPCFTPQLVALEPNKHVKWVFKTGSDIKSSPAIGADGTIYFGSRDRALFAVTPQGKEKWKHPVEGWVDSSPAIGADGAIYFGSWDQKFYALDPAGRQHWEFVTGGVVDSSPAIGADETIYFGSHDHKFYALKPDGTLKWSFLTGGAIISSPAIATDGTVYFTSVDGNFYALTPEGRLKWKLHTGGIRSSSPALDPKGGIYVGVNDYIVGINADGTRRKEWEFRVYDPNYPLYIDSSPAVTADNLVVFGTDPGGVAAFSVTNCQLVWGVFLGGSVKTPPTVAPDGTVYVGSNATKFHSVKGTQGLAASSWPKFRGNLRQTGRVADNR
jgi:outer membrane protein assembly factor BamB